MTGRPAPDALPERRELGSARPQVLAPAGTWQATEPVEDEVPLSCVVSPGSTWEGFGLG